MYTSTIESAADASSVRSVRSLKSTPLSRFISWSESQSDARFIWIGVILLTHASFLTPFTVMAVVFNGNSFSLIMAALAAMGLALVTNLAALPTKVTIPAFLLSIVADIVIVAIAMSGVM